MYAAVPSTPCCCPPPLCCRAFPKPDTLLDLLLAMLVLDPAHRITAAAALQHEWFRQVSASRCQFCSAKFHAALWESPCSPPACCCIDICAAVRRASFSTSAGNPAQRHAAQQQGPCTGLPSTQHSSTFDVPCCRIRCRVQTACLRGWLAGKRPHTRSAPCGHVEVAAERNQ